MIAVAALRGAAAHTNLCDAGDEGTRPHSPDSTVEHVTPQVRQDVHDALAQSLTAAWLAL
jgi:hypothetical protein